VVESMMDSPTSVREGYALNSTRVARAGAA
jgi:hypothetical protein